MDWMKFKNIYFAISGIVIALGVFSLIKWGLTFGVDFSGGSVIEYRLKSSVTETELTETLNKEGINLTSVQNTTGSTYLFRLPPISEETKNKIDDVLKKKYKEVDGLRFEVVGPTVGPELIKKTIVALLVSSCAILFWVAFQFKSIKFGASAILAMFHDSVVLVGTYSLLGHFYGAEVDFLFALTILSFSVHDTIVVFDRVREINKRSGRNLGGLKGTVNIALTETMVRSLNNSFTILFMLLALILLGGTTIKWFAVALFIGTVSGTYSSPFVAVPILVTWDEVASKIKPKKNFFKK